MAALTSIIYNSVVYTPGPVQQYMIAILVQNCDVAPRTYLPAAAALLVIVPVREDDYESDDHGARWPYRQYYTGWTHDLVFGFHLFL